MHQIRIYLKKIRISFLKRLIFAKDLKKIIFNFKPDIVFHLAAESHVDNSIVNSKNFY